MLVPTGRGTVQMEITPPPMYEAALALRCWTRPGARRSRSRRTCAPHYKRIQGPGSPAASCDRAGGGHGHPHGLSRGCMAGFGFCFVSHIGEVGGLRVPAAVGGETSARHRCRRSIGIRHSFRALRTRTCCRAAAGNASTACCAAAVGRGRSGRRGNYLDRSRSVPISRRPSTIAN